MRWLIVVEVFLNLVLGLIDAKPIRKGFGLGNTSEATYLKDSDLAMSVSHSGITRAYPIRILNYHEIVNDKIADLAFAVTYCPVCGTGMVFDRTIEGKETTFGVSGLLFQSDVLLYDRESESLWAQLKMESISGPRIGTELRWLTSEFMNWEAWKAKYPDGSVLSIETGYRRNYRLTPYRGYETSEGVYLPVPWYRQELGVKDWIIGVILDGKSTAYDVRLFETGKVYTDGFAVRKLELVYSPYTRHARISDSKTGDTIPHVFAYWFAWQAFYPETRLLSPKKQLKGLSDSGHIEE